MGGTRDSVALQGGHEHIPVISSCLDLRELLSETGREIICSRHKSIWSFIAHARHVVVRNLPQLRAAFKVSINNFIQWSRQGSVWRLIAVASGAAIVSLVLGGLAIFLAIVAAATLNVLFVVAFLAVVAIGSCLAFFLGTAIAVLLGTLSIGLSVTLFVAFGLICFTLFYSGAILCSWLAWTLVTRGWQQTLALVMDTVRGGRAKNKGLSSAPPPSLSPSTNGSLSANGGLGLPQSGLPTETGTEAKEVYTTHEVKEDVGDQKAEPAQDGGHLQSSSPAENATSDEHPPTHATYSEVLKASEASGNGLPDVLPSPILVGA
eukprot:jgi/Mesen1/7989/ME000425S07185